MKIELVRDGEVYRVKDKESLSRLPEKLTVEIPLDRLDEQLKAFEGKVVKIWSPVFPPGAGRAMKEFLDRTQNDGDHD